MLIGCGYTRLEKNVAKDALSVAAKLARGPVRAIRSCCGLSSLYAGDRDGFQAAATRFAAEAASFPRLIVVDPGYARTVSLAATSVVMTNRSSKRVPNVGAFREAASE